MISFTLSRCARTGVLLFSLVLAACGGGGGGGGGSSSGGGGGNTDTNKLTLSSNSVAFAMFQNDVQFQTQEIRVSWSSSKVAGFVVGTLPGQPMPTWLAVEAIGTTSPVTLRFTCIAQLVPPGHQAATLRIISGDANANPLAQQDVQVSMDLVPEPVVSIGALTWVETEGPADLNVTVTRDSRITMSSVSVDSAPWVSAAISGDAIALKRTADSATHPPGNLAGALRTVFTLGAQSHTVVTPLSATVTPALTGPATLDFSVDAATQAADLTGQKATITTATAAATAFTVQSDVPWLMAMGGTTGVANNLSISLLGNQLPQLSFGNHEATLTVTPANGATPLHIPVKLDLHLPEIHFVAPVAFTDTLDTDYVIVRGAGFTSRAFRLFVDGSQVSNFDLVNDTELRLVPGQMAVGDHPVSTSNALGATRDSAKLRVTDPPPYANALISANIGLQQHMISSPINRAVFTSRCYFCDTYENQPVGNLSVVNRFGYDAGTGEWIRVERFYPNLYDIALSPDESLLIVLTRTDLRMVDPNSLQTLDIYPLPNDVAGIARQLAVLNNGLVFIDAAHRVFSLRTRTFVDFPAVITSSDGGMVASLDGSRALFGQATNSGDVPYGYIDASTNTVVTTNTREHYCCGAYSRHATVALVNSYVLDKDVKIFGQLPYASYSGDVAPDGKRSFGPDYSAGTLRGFDLTGPAPFAEFPPIPLETQLVGRAGRFVIDPAGRVGFMFTERWVQLIELP